MALLWRLEGNSQELVFSIMWIPGNQFKSLYPLNWSYLQLPITASALALCLIEKDLRHE